MICLAIRSFADPPRLCRGMVRSWTNQSAFAAIVATGYS